METSLQFIAWIGAVNALFLLMRIVQAQLHEWDKADDRRTQNVIAMLDKRPTWTSTKTTITPTKRKAGKRKAVPLSGVG